MVSTRVSVMALLTIALVARYEQASAVTCYVCSSFNDPKCATKPQHSDLMECNHWMLAAETILETTGLNVSEPMILEGSANKSAVLNGSESGAITIPHRIQRRHAPHYTCAVLKYKELHEAVVERRCVSKKMTCKGLMAGKKDANCLLCTADGCNASSTLSLGLMSVLVPVGLIALFTR